MEQVALAARAKVVVVVPCLNEAETLPMVLGEIPRDIAGTSVVEVIVVDDGSTDGTAGVARAHGADGVIRFEQNRGLAAARTAGADEALARGAHIVVETDGDGQYVGADIERLVLPILAGDAALVLGDRQVSTSPHFTASRRFLQRLGTAVVARAAGLPITDAVTGFRAMSRDTCARTIVTNAYTGSVETLIVAGHRGVPVLSVPIRTRETRRPSRLFKTVWGYVFRQAVIIVVTTVAMRPLPVYGGVALGLALAGVALAQPLVGAAAVIVGLLGLHAAQAAQNRRVLEDIVARQRLGE